MSSYNFLEGTIPQKIVIAQDFKIKPNDATSDLSASFLAGEEYTNITFVAKINSDLGLADGALTIGEDSYLSHERTRELFASLGADNGFTGTNVFHNNVDISGAAHNLIIEGKVGIGKTDVNDNFALDVSGNMNASGDISSRNLTVAGNLQVDGSVNFLGELIQTDTKIQVSEILDISANDGSGNALTVRQNGTTQDIAHFYNGTSPAMVIDKVGNVGIGKTDVSDNFALDVSGNMNASGDISSRNLTVAGNLQVDGSVNFLGELIQTDTKIQVSEILDISANDGSGNALTVRQNGTTQDIAHFYNGTSPAMVIDKVGNVGIGTNTPSNLLDIYKYSGLGQPPMLNIVGEFRGDNGNGTYSSTIANIEATGSLTAANPGGTGDTMIGLNVDIGAGSFSVTNKYAALFNGGNVGIGTTTPSYKLHVNGSVGGQTFTATSDIRFKENIVDLSNALQKICSIRGVNYNFKDSSESKHAGVIAQEVDEIIPEAINKNDNKKWSVNYNTLFSYYVEAIKELNHKNDDLVQKNNELMKTVECMKSMMLSMRDDLDSLKKH